MPHSAPNSKATSWSTHCVVQNGFVRSIHPRENCVIFPIRLLNRPPGPFHFYLRFQIFMDGPVFSTGMTSHKKNWAWGTIEQGEPPFIFLCRPHSHTLCHKTAHSWVATLGPRGISCRRLCSFHLFGPSNLWYIERGTLLNRGNHFSFSRFDPVVTSSTTRPPTDASRPRAYEAYRVGDHVRSLLFDPQTWDIQGVGYCWVRGTTIPFPV